MRLALLATTVALVATALTPIQTAGAVGPVSASSSADAEHAPGKAFDGDLTTSWRAAGGGTQWLMVDYELPTAMSRVRQTFADRDMWTFTIEGSLDGATWMTLMDRSKGIAGQSFAVSVTGVYRYVKLTVTGAANGSVPSSTELQLKGSATEVDITPRNATVYTGSSGAPPTGSADGAKPGFEGKYLVDGDSSTYWVAGNHLLPKWATVDLGTPTVLSSVEQNFKDYLHWRFKISGSNDNVNFTTLRDFGVDNPATGPIQGQHFHLTVSGTYRYVRLTITQTEFGGWAGAPEMMVFTPLVGNGPVRDLAYGTTATASTVATNFEPWRAVDGRIGYNSTWVGCWVPAPDNCVRPPGINGEWLKIDLGHVSLVTGIEQRFFDNDVWWFTVEGSLDGVTWQQLVSRQGVAGQTFSEPLRTPGRYRYIRLNLPRASQAGHWPSSERLRVYGYGSPLPYKRWTEQSGPLQRFYVKHYQIPLNSITAQLPNLKAQGYAGVELATPIKGPRSPFGGLGATDNYAIEPSVGTMADFQNLIATAHNLGMKVVMFHNLGYSSPEAPFWNTAQTQPTSIARKWFDIVPASGPSACNNSQRWYWSALARGCYFAFWDPNLPSYNWASLEWRNEASKILKFWMDKGLDGLGIDAPRTYHRYDTVPGSTQRHITAVLDAYDSWTLPEGLQPNWAADDPGDLVNGVRELHYNTVHDLSINRWGCTTDCSRIVGAMRTGDAGPLENYFKYSRDEINQQGGITLLPPSWDSDVNGDGTINPNRLEPASVRLLEMATILTSGNQFIMHYGNHLYVPHDRTIPNWTATQQQMVTQLLQAQAGTSAFDPRGLRFRVPTGAGGTFDSRHYAFVRTDKASGTRAIAVLNFQNTTQTLDVRTLNTGIARDQIPIDLLTGQPASTPIVDGNLRITLPARGFAVLSVR